MTDRIRNKVKLLLALGWSGQRVADAIEVSLATLKRYFRAELRVRDMMRDRLDAERIMVVAEQAMAGNVGAARELQRLIDRNDRMEAERRLGTSPEKSEAAKPTDGVGKKVAAAQLALEVDEELAAELEAEAAVNARH